MADPLASSIHEQIIAFLVGDLSLPEFQDWLVGATWDVEQRSPQSVDLTYEIKLALAEHSRGDISAHALRERLSDLAETVTKIAHMGTSTGPILVFGTSSESIIVESGSPLVRTQYAVASW